MGAEEWPASSRILPTAVDLQLQDVQVVCGAAPVTPGFVWVDSHPTCQPTLCHCYLRLTLVMLQSKVFQRYMKGGGEGNVSAGLLEKGPDSPFPLPVEADLGLDGAPMALTKVGLWRLVRSRDFHWTPLRRPLETWHRAPGRIKTASMGVSQNNGFFFKWMMISMSHFPWCDFKGSLRLRYTTTNPLVGYKPTS